MTVKSALHQPLLAVMRGTDFDPGLAVERQITLRVRQLIQAGALAPGVRLPPIRLLAELWNTNYFTVQTGLRVLVREGLLLQSPRLGTFVATQERSLQRVFLYHAEDLKFRGGSEFGGRLHMNVYRMLAARGIQTISHFDHRPDTERSTMPVEMGNLLKDRQIDAVIGTTRYEPWFNDLDVPVACVGLQTQSGGVWWNVREFVRLAMDALRQAGSRRVCVLHRQSLAATRRGDELSEGMKVIMEAAIREAGLQVIEAPEDPVGKPGRDMEGTGFAFGEQIAAMSLRPDALIVFPDTYTRGVVSAFLKHGVDVPGDMILISHRNEEMPFFTPFPVTWLTVRIEDYAEALLRQIEAQINGERPSSIDVPVSSEPPGDALLARREPGKISARARGRR